MAVGRAAEAEATPTEVAKLLEDLEAFELPPEKVAQIRAQLMPKATDSAFLVHPANAVAVKLFQALATQWRAIGISTMAKAEIRQTGLRYGEIREVAVLAGLELDLPTDFTRIRIMEAEALAAFAEARR